MGLNWANIKVLGVLCSFPEVVGENPICLFHLLELT